MTITQPLKALQKSAYWQPLQPIRALFASIVKGISLPAFFTRPYKICLLEQCLVKDCETEINRRRLERCCQKTARLHSAISPAGTRFRKTSRKVTQQWLLGPEWR